MDRYFGDDLPQGILPMELSAITQDWLLANATLDEGGLSADNPRISIRKKTIFLEIQQHDDKSDFFSIKDLLETYPGEEILMLFDDECCYGAKFLLCYSEDTKNTVLEMMREEAECCYIPIQPKEWNSLGSDATMADFTVTNTRKRLAVKLRASATVDGSQRVAQQLTWSAITHITLKTDEDQTAEKASNAMETPLNHDVKVQAVPEFVHAVAQTTLRHPRNAWTQFQPQLFKESQLEEIHESPGVKSFLGNVTDKVIDGLMNNELVDCFRRDWAILREPLEGQHRGSVETLSRSTSRDSAVEDGEPNVDVGTSKSVDAPGLEKVDGITSTTCLDYLNMCDGKTVSSISVHPENPDIIGASYREFDRTQQNKPRKQARRRMRPPPGFALIWSLRDPMRPRAILEAPSEISCLAFNPKDSQSAAGSLENGSVVLWKLGDFVSASYESSKGIHTGEKGRGSNEQHGMMTDVPSVIPWSLTSIINHCHKGPITDLYWLPGDLRLSDTVQLSYWTSEQAGRNDDMDDPDMMLASDLAGLTKKNPRYHLMTVGMDSVVKFWQFESSMLDNTPASEQDNVKHAGGKITRKVADVRYKWVPLAEVMFQESAKKPIAGILRAKLIPTDAPKTHYSTVQMKGRAKSELEPRSPSPRQLKGDDVPSLIVAVTDSGIMYTGDLKTGRREEAAGGNRMQLISPSSMLTQVLGNPIALVQNPGKNHDRVFLWVSSTSWAVCVSDGSVPAMSTAGPAHESMMFYTSAAWIPWRPSAFILGTKDGSLHVWDLLRDTSRAVASDKFGVSQIVALEFIDGASPAPGPGKQGQENKSTGKRSAKVAQQQAHARLIVAGDSSGEIHVANVSNVDYLRPFSPAEAASFADGVHLGRVCTVTKKARDLMPHPGD